MTVAAESDDVGYHFVERTECPACASRQVREIFSCRFDEAPIADVIRAAYRRDPAALGDAIYRLDACDQCRSVYQAWVGDDPFLEQLYSRWIVPEVEDPATFEPWVRILARPEASRDGHEILMAASALNRAGQPLRTLDYGMGHGIWAQVAARLGCESWGFDLASECVEYARSRGVQIWGEDDATRFDLINTEQVFEHLPEPFSVLKRLASRLSAGGLLKISVPRGDQVRQRLANPDWLAPAGSSRSLNAVHPLEHVNAFTGDGVDALARRAGLKPIAIGMRHRLAFVRSSRAIPRAPADLVKAVVRPVQRFHSAHNLYRWFTLA